MGKPLGFYDSRCPVDPRKQHWTVVYVKHTCVDIHIFDIKTSICYAWPSRNAQSIVIDLTKQRRSYAERRHRHMLRYEMPTAE